MPYRACMTTSTPNSKTLLKMHLFNLKHKLYSNGRPTAL